MESNITQRCCWFTIFVLTGTISYLSAINQGYNNCLQGTGQQKPLLLQDGLRCVQIQPETKNWADAMNLCNSRQGHLLHIYSSDEVQLIHDWLLSLPPLTEASWIGSKKFGPLNDNFTGYNIRWMTSVSTDIGLDQTYQYPSIDWEGGGGHGKAESRMAGCTWSHVNPHLYGRGTFCGETVATLHVLCQFFSDKPPTILYRGYMGKRSLAPIYETFDQKNSIRCGVVCSENAWCLGFNAIESGSKTTCQLISIKLKDTQAGITQDNSVNYYERIQG